MDNIVTVWTLPFTYVGIHTKIMDELQIANEVKLITDYEDLDVWARQRGLTNHPAVTNRHLDIFIENHCSDNTHQQPDTTNKDQGGD